MTYFYEYDENGGYDCMYAAFIVRDTRAESWQRVVTVDFGNYGQKACDLVSPETRAAAEEVAKKIVVALNAPAPEARATSLWEHVPVACHNLGINFMDLRDECDRLAGSPK